MISKISTSSWSGIAINKFNCLSNFECWNSIITGGVSPAGYIYCAIDEVKYYECLFEANSVLKYSLMLNLNYLGRIKLYKGVKQFYYSKDSVKKVKFIKLDEVKVITPEEFLELLPVNLATEFLFNLDLF